ncbi:MAG TPA: glycosyltransferase family 4 protein [Ktedonobacteraceae bacterium]|nr:glycosyltransferase family 4 protein [Ktedonobacteraceae bacterium]
MPNILFITPYYFPEKGAAAVRITETASRLVKRGHTVVVLTTLPNYPTGIVPPEYQVPLPHEEMLDGVQVIRVWSYISPSKSFLHRILAQLSFGCLSPFLGRTRIGHPDIIIVESHPLFNAIAGRLLAWRKRCPFIFTVSDLWPESAVQLGVLRNRLLIRLAEWLEWSSYKRAALIWALSRGIRDQIVERGIPQERVMLLTNGANLSLFTPIPQTQARAELGWEDRFTILYAGTYGLSHKLSTVLEAAECLREYTDIQFILVGDGVDKASLLAQAQERALANVTFLDAQPHELMPKVLAAADICLVPMRKLPLFEGRLPLKMFEIMASARPFVLGVEGEARQLAVQEARAALAVEPENVRDLVDSILYLYKHPQERELLGQRGRNFVEAKYDREQLTAILDASVANLLGKQNVVSNTPTFVNQN